MAKFYGVERPQNTPVITYAITARSSRSHTSIPFVLSLDFNKMNNTAYHFTKKPENLLIPIKHNDTDVSFHEC